VQTGKILMANYLFYISQNYSFEILRPLQQAIWARGDRCAWFVEGNQINLKNFEANETQLASIEAVIDFAPLAVFVPGNVVPNFIPGFKVQVFHGLEYKKKGHFRIRDFFDLYCTQGIITTSEFQRLAQLHKNFHVVETGWSKLDPLFKTRAYAVKSKLPVILYAPTFSPNLTSAVECFKEIKRLVDKGEQYWLVKFHPKMNPQWIEMYQQIKADNFEIVTIDSCLPLLQTADILLSDTSSMVGEFLLLNKPVVTFKNANPGNYLINIDSPANLEVSIATGLTKPSKLMQLINNYGQKLHPYSDGKASHRVLQAVDQLIKEPVELDKKRPINIFRSLTLRKKLGYWKL
jgi:CDP-glycerol glycerophosphotransferase (TagB/SpsB family)